MLRRVLKLSTSPKTLLRSVLALDDSPHAIALGVGIGIFVGLTPSVGIQTILILGVILATRPFFYFNGTAAMASTYISNPLTMAPMYYFWYRLGAWFIPGTDTNVNFDSLLKFDGLAGWWQSTASLAVQVGTPMLVGALLTAPIGAAIAYPLTHYLVRVFRKSSGDDSSGSNSSDADSSSTATEETAVREGRGRVDVAHQVPAAKPNSSSDSADADHDNDPVLAVWPSA